VLGWVDAAFQPRKGHTALALWSTIYTQSQSDVTLGDFRSLDLKKRVLRHEDAHNEIAIR